MRSTAGFVMFITFFMTLYLAVNGYVVIRLSGLLGIKRGWYVYAAAAALGLSLVGAMYLEAKIGNRLTGWLLTGAANWIGVLWILFWCLVIYELLALGVKLPARTAGWVIVVVGTAIVTYAALNARRLKVSEMALPGPGPLRLVQMTDVHLGAVERGFLRRVVERVNALKPDAVFITGDLVDNHNEKTATELKALDDLQAPVFMVSGNHERYVGLENVEHLMAQTKVRLLRDEAVDFRGIQIVGLDDGPDLGPMIPRLQRLGVDGGKYAVLLYHRPLGLETAAQAGVKLMLSGHTHNGQLFPFNFFVQQAFRRITGLYEWEGTTLRVSPGTGTWGPRMRLGSNSEILLVRLGDGT